MINSNPLVSITLGNGVFIDNAGILFDNAFNHGFIRFYDNNGKKTGTYTGYGNNWTYSPR